MNSVRAAAEVLQVLDPARSSANPLPRPVLIESVVAAWFDGKRVPRTMVMQQLVAAWRVLRNFQKRPV